MAKKIEYIFKDLEDLLISVFSIWNNSGINYLVLRNYENLPDIEKGDLDILVDGKCREQAEISLLKIANKLGWKLVKRIEFWPISLWFCKPSKQIYIHIDIFCSLNASIFDILSTASVLQNKIKNTFFFVPSPVDEAIICILPKVIEAGMINDKYKEKIINLIRNDLDNFILNLSSVIGVKYTHLLTYAILQRRWHDLKPFKKILYIILLKRNLKRNPLLIIKNAYNKLLRFLKRIHKPPGLIIAVVGPDGAGKSSTIKEIYKHWKHNPIFFGTLFQNWRPGILPSLGKILKKSPNYNENQANNTPRRIPGRYYILRFVYYSFDFILGSWLKDFYEIVKFRFVVYDRCFLDIFADPARYGFSSSAGADLTWRLMRKPDLVILLYNEPQKVYERKKELSLSEIQEQYIAWFKLLKDGYINYIVESTSSAKDTFDAIKSLIIDWLSESNASLNNRNYDPINFLYSIFWQNGKYTLLKGKKPTKINCNRKNIVYETYGRINRRDGGLLLIPFKNRLSACGSLSLLHTQTIRGNCLKGILWMLINIGIAPYVFKKYFVVNKSCVTFYENNMTSILDSLRHKFKTKKLYFGILLGAPVPHQKPVLAAITHRGDVRAYIKIGVDRLTKKLVENEYTALSTFSRYNLKFGRFPKPIEYTQFYDKNILIIQALKLKRLNLSKHQTLVKKFLLEIAGIEYCSSPFLNSNFFSDLKYRIDETKKTVPYYQKLVLEKGMTTLQQYLKNTNVPWVWRLGDFVPWNIGINIKKEKIYVIDLEFASKECLLGWDIFHFYSMRYKSVKEQIESIYLKHYGTVSSYFQYFNIDENFIPGLHLAYLLDLTSIGLEMWHLTKKNKLKESYKDYRNKIISITIINEIIKNKRINIT